MLKYKRVIIFLTLTISGVIVIGLLFGCWHINQNREKAKEIAIATVVAMDAREFEVEKTDYVIGEECFLIYLKSKDGASERTVKVSFPADKPFRATILK